MLHHNGDIGGLLLFSNFFALLKWKKAINHSHGVKQSDEKHVMERGEFRNGIPGGGGGGAAFAFTGIHIFASFILCG